MSKLPTNKQALSEEDLGKVIGGVNTGGGGTGDVSSVASVSSVSAVAGSASPLASALARLMAVLGLKAIKK